MSELKMPFEIGQVFWQSGGPSVTVKVECPMCCGKKKITAILGTGEQYKLDCDTCNRGYAGSQGYIEQYTREPHADKFVILKAIEWSRGDWRVESTKGTTAYFSVLYDTEKEALDAATKWKEKLDEDNMASLRKKKYGRVSSWSIQYHQGEIRRNEKSIEWHRDKIQLKKEGK